MELITGDNFIKRCNYHFVGTGNIVIREPNIGEIPKYFICLENTSVDLFFTHFKPTNEFIIVTHNSDIHIDNKFLNYLNDDLLFKWYSQNVDLVHPKLISIPIGIANEIWLHGDSSKVNHYIDSKSFFMISPRGNGVDCHRNWESIYLKTIPIITESINFTHFYKDFPFLIIKDWSELDVSVLTEENYHKIWNNFDINKLNVDSFLNL